MMSTSSTVPKGSSLSADLNNFIYGVSRRNFQNAADLTKVGISLLKSFPAARDAVLEYFSMVFHDAVNYTLNQPDYESDPSPYPSLESVSMIGPELCGLGASWAPFIAPWCITLLTNIATDKSNVPISTLQTLEPVRVLLDITTQNLTLLNNEERANCIDMMISCRACSWAVGWVGRAEPALVAPRALALGADAARAVLQHFAAHPPALFHVRAALLDLFNDAISEESLKSERKRDVIPYLLNLASKSDIVLKALIQDIEKTLTEDIIDRMYAIYSISRHGAAWEGVGPELLVALMMRADAKCFLLLMRRAARDPAAKRLLEFLLQKLEFESMSPDRKIPLLESAAEEAHDLREKLLTGNRLEQCCLARILIIVCYNLPSEFVSTISYLIQHSRSDATLALLVRIISGTIAMHVPNDSPDVCMDTERYQGFIKSGVERALRDSMLADQQIKRIFVTGQVPSDQKTYLHHYCLNLITLLRWENSTRVSHLRTRPFGRAASCILGRLGGALRERTDLLRPRPPCTCEALPEMPTCHALAEVLDRIDMSGSKGPPAAVDVIVKVVKATVKYFFRCIHEKEIMDKLRGTQTACRLLRKLCLHSKLARALALRDLLETAMFREGEIFGSRADIDAATDPTKDWTEEELLIHLNQKHGPITQLTQSHTSVFHAGIIGWGPRKPRTNLPPPDTADEILTTNNELLCGALVACMDGNSGIVEGATSISLLLVELISPDVMYNGLPWPDEDFTKQVSIERELYTSSTLSGCGVARAALRRCAAARPALCLASALLRAAAAAALHRERALHDRTTASAETRRERKLLSELLSTMTLGQLLPRPLCHALEVTPSLTNDELVQVLRDCLWNYTRDHVPSPALFTCDSTGLHWRDPATSKPPPQYTDTLRLMVQKKIAQLGHLYPIMFLNLEKSES